jgi:Tfp pilus assembly protein PilO
VPSGSRPVAAGSEGQLAGISLTLSVAGGYFQVEQFVANLENLPRALRISSLSIVPGVNPVNKASTNVEDGKSLVSTVTGQVFMAANRAPAASVTAPTAVAPVTVAPAKK